MISVIVPTYKVEDYLENCIKTLIGQTYKDLQIILVDDGSPDNCPSICDEWAEKDDRIVVIHKENGGVSSARNLGIEKATGDYISFIDPDDVISNDYYEIMINSIGDCECALCGFQEFSNSITFNDEIQEVSYLTNDEALKLGICMHPEIYFVVWNKIIKSEIAKQCRFDETMKNAEDSLFAFNIIKSCSKVCVISKKMYGYYLRDNGAVAKIDIKGRLDILKMLNTVNDYYQNNGDKAVKKHSKETYFMSVFYNYCELKTTATKQEIKPFRNALVKNLSVLLYTKRMNIKEKISLVISLIGG